MILKGKPQQNHERDAKATPADSAVDTLAPPPPATLLDRLHNALTTGQPLPELNKTEFDQLSNELDAAGATAFAPQLKQLMTGTGDAESVRREVERMVHFVRHELVQAATVHATETTAPVETPRVEIVEIPDTDTPVAVPPADTIIAPAPVAETPRDVAAPARPQAQTEIPASAPQAVVIPVPAPAQETVTVRAAPFVEPQAVTINTVVSQVSFFAAATPATDINPPAAKETPAHSEAPQVEIEAATTPDAVTAPVADAAVDTTIRMALPMQRFVANKQDVTQPLTVSVPFALSAPETAPQPQRQNTIVFTPGIPEKLATFLVEQSPAVPQVAPVAPAAETTAAVDALPVVPPTAQEAPQAVTTIETPEAVVEQIASVQDAPQHDDEAPVMVRIIESDVSQDAAPVFDEQTVAVNDNVDVVVSQIEPETADISVQQQFAEMNIVPTEQSNRGTLYATFLEETVIATTKEGVADVFDPAAQPTCLYSLYGYGLAA